jgi:hypothetical protein
MPGGLCGLLKLVFGDFYDPVRATVLQQQQHIAAHVESLVIAGSLPHDPMRVDESLRNDDLTCFTDVLNSPVNTSTYVPRETKGTDDVRSRTDSSCSDAWLRHVHVHDQLSGGSPGRVCTTPLGIATTREVHPAFRFTP